MTIFTKLIVAVGTAVGWCGRHARSFLTTAAELAGLALVALGVGQIFAPAGVITVGLGLILVGYLEGQNR